MRFLARCRNAYPISGRRKLYADNLRGSRSHARAHTFPIMLSKRCRSFADYRSPLMRPEHTGHTRLARLISPFLDQRFEQSLYYRVPEAGSKITSYFTSPTSFLSLYRPSPSISCFIPPLHRGSCVPRRLPARKNAKRRFLHCSAGKDQINALR